MLASPDRAPPSEEELRELYDSVLFGFESETPPLRIKRSTANLKLDHRHKSSHASHSLGDIPAAGISRNDVQSSPSPTLTSPVSAPSPSQERLRTRLLPPLPGSPATSASSTPVPDGSGSVLPLNNIYETRVTPGSTAIPPAKVPAFRRLPDAPGIGEMTLSSRPKPRATAQSSRPALQTSMNDTLDSRASSPGIVSMSQITPLSSSYRMHPVLSPISPGRTPLTSDRHNFERPKGSPLPSIPSVREPDKEEGTYTGSFPIRIDTSQTLRQTGNQLSSAHVGLRPQPSAQSLRSPQDINSPYPRSLLPGGIRPLPNPTQTWTPSSPSSYRENSSISPVEPLSAVSSSSRQILQRTTANEEDDGQFFSLPLLSHIAVRLQDRIPRGTYVTRGEVNENAFTGEDIITTLRKLVCDEMLFTFGISSVDDNLIYQIAASLSSQLFFYDVTWSSSGFKAGREDVYRLLDEPGNSNEAAELPTGVFPALSPCYSADCCEGRQCYSYACPLRPKAAFQTMRIMNPDDTTDSSATLRGISINSIERQLAIQTAISDEEAYIEQLDAIESVYMEPLYTAKPPIISEGLDSFMDDVFGVMLEVRECHRRLVEQLLERQDDLDPANLIIGDIYLVAATEFRSLYTTYIACLLPADERYNDESRDNLRFREWVEKQHSENNVLNFRHALYRPYEYLKTCTKHIDTILDLTEEGTNDKDFLFEAATLMHKLPGMARLRAFQLGAVGDRATTWDELVDADELTSIPEAERRRQRIIFELISTEMSYVSDLGSFETTFIQPLQRAYPPIISRGRQDIFIKEVFNSQEEVFLLHRKTLRFFQDLQFDEHPVISSLGPAFLEIARELATVFVHYVQRYPGAAQRIEDELARNTALKAFVERASGGSDSPKRSLLRSFHLLEPLMKQYRYLLRKLLTETPKNNEDSFIIPQVLDILADVGRESGIARPSRYQ